MWSGTEQEYGTAMLALVFGKIKHGGEGRSKPKLPPSPSGKQGDQQAAFLPKYLLRVAPFTTRQIADATGCAPQNISGAVCRLIKSGYLIRTNGGKKPVVYATTPKGRARLASGYNEKGGRHGRA